jgi:hypothetical protein
MGNEKKCKFDVNGVCYVMVCYTDLRCGAKDDAGNIIRRASGDQIRERSRLIETIKGDVMPKMTVMQPTVVNVDGPLENVASDKNDAMPDLDCGIYDSEQSSILPKLE